MQGPEAVIPPGQPQPRLAPEPAPAAHAAPQPPGPPPPTGGMFSWDAQFEDLRRLTKNGWLCVIVGLLIPPLELLAGAVAIKLLTRDRIAHGVTMLVFAIAIFATRLALYVGG